MKKILLLTKYLAIKPQMKAIENSDFVIKVDLNQMEFK